MYRGGGGGESKAKIERSSTVTSSRTGVGGLNLNGKVSEVFLKPVSLFPVLDRCMSVLPSPYGHTDQNVGLFLPHDERVTFSSDSSLEFFANLIEEAEADELEDTGEENVVDESETDSEESDVSGSEGEDTSWISWFCSLRGNEFLCEVDENYIQDDFNLCGLSTQVPYYDYALDLILDVESSHGDMFSEKQNEIIESAAKMLYGLIHVRYILTTKGLGVMLEKYKNAEFGRCPRLYCCGQPCLPVGQSDVSRQSNIKIFCPKCEDIYTPQSRFQDNLDGAYFGSTFAHLFLMTYGHLKPQNTTRDYIPRIFGFKVHKP